MQPDSGPHWTQQDSLTSTGCRGWPEHETSTPEATGWEWFTDLFRFTERSVGE